MSAPRDDGLPRVAGALQSEALAPGMVVGLFGGSFNPVHRGHWHVAETARKRLQLGRVWWLVSPQNPLKSSGETADYRERVARVRRLIGRRPRHVVSTLEARIGVRRTAETVAHLVRRWPQVRFVWIMGGDNLGGFHRWGAWRSIAQMAPIAVVSRPGVRPPAGLACAAQALRPYRVLQENAGLTVVRRPPVWVYLTARYNNASSTALRVQAQC